MVKSSVTTLWKKWDYAYKRHETGTKHKTCFGIYVMITIITNCPHDAVPGSIVGTATAYGLDGPGFESQWGRDFPHLSRPAPRPTQPPVQWIPGLSRG
jgi:hypothetical protein